MLTRSEHLAHCKKYALEYLNAGEIDEASTVMMIELEQHPETKGHAGIQLGFLLKMNGFLSTDKQVREWIMGFNENA